MAMNLKHDAHGDAFLAATLPAKVPQDTSSTGSRHNVKTSKKKRTFLLMQETKHNWFSLIFGSILTQ